MQKYTSSGSLEVLPSGVILTYDSHWKQPAPLASQLFFLQFSPARLIKQVSESKNFIVTRNTIYKRESASCVPLSNEAQPPTEETLPAKIS